MVSNGARECDILRDYHGIFHTSIMAVIYPEFGFVTFSSAYVVIKEQTLPTVRGSTAFKLWIRFLGRTK